MSANLVSSRGGSPPRATWTHTGADCQQSGTKTITQTAGDLTSNGRPQDGLPPCDLSGTIIPIGPTNSTMTVNLSNCSDPDKSPSSMVTSLAFTPLKIGGQSADGLDFSGNLTDTLGAVTNWHWTLHGTS